MREEYRKELDQLRSSTEAVAQLAEELPHFEEVIVREKQGIITVHLADHYKELRLIWGINRYRYNSEEGTYPTNFKGYCKENLWSVYINTLILYGSHKRYGLDKLAEKVFYFDRLNSTFYARTGELLPLLDSLVDWNNGALRQLRVDREEEIIEYLEGLANGTIEPSDKEFGLCYSLKQEGLHIPRLIQIFESWDRFSGDPDHPVPHPKKASKIDACRKYHKTANLWKGKYGKLRKELCQYVADYIAENGLLDQEAV